MKIAIVTNGASTLVNFRGPLMMKMISLGHEVLAFAPDHDETTRKELSDMGIEAVDFRMSRSSTNPLHELRSIFDLMSLFRFNQIELTFAYFLKPVIYGTIAAALAGVHRRYGLIAGLGFAFTDDGSTFRGARKQTRSVIFKIARFSLSRIDKLMFQNQDDHYEFVSRNIVLSEKAIVVGATGLDLRQWSLAPLPEGPTVFVLAARLLRDKGIGEYVEAAKIVRKSYPDVRFLLLGRIDDNPAAISKDEIRGWVSEGVIEWPGYVQVRPWLEQAHVFVLPSYYREGVPRSIQEAMALGRPILTTDLPGCRETVVDGENGYFVPARDPITLARAMEHLIENPHLVSELGQNSRILAEERFDVEKLNAITLRVMGLS